MPRKAAPAIEVEDQDEDQAETPPAGEDDELSAVLAEIGGGDALTLSIWRTRPRRGFVTKVSADAFDVAEFARTYGGGEYEIRVYRAGAPGLLRRVSLPIDDSIRPASAQLAGTREPARDDVRDMMHMMFQQAVESQRQQTQLLTALIARPAPAIDPALLALLTNRSGAGELAELVKVAQNLAGAGAGNDWAGVVKAGLEAIPALAQTAAAPPPPPRPMAQNVRQRAALPGKPAGASAPGGALVPPTTTDKSLHEAGTGVSGQSGAPQTPTPAEQAAGEGMGRLLTVFQAFRHDPAPSASEYARKVVEAIGEDRVTDAIDTTKSGELAVQLAGFVEGVPPEFLRDVETTLRAWFEEDAE